MRLTKIHIGVMFLSLLSINLYAQDACPNIKLSGPAGITRVGEPMAFSAIVDENNAKLIGTYNWTISAGTIIEGQGTPAIKVDTNGLGSQAITATLTLTFTGFQLCENNLSEVGVVEEIPKAVLFEKTTNQTCEFRQMVMDGYFTQLNNDPSAAGYIFTFGSPRTVAKLERQMRANLKWRKYDESRITFINGGGRSKKATIEFWVVPAGAEIPKPEPPVEDAADFDTTEDKTETNPKEPYIFSAEYDDGGACIDENMELDLDGYAKFLKENPKTRGNIMIMMMTKTEFRQKEAEILKFLTKKGIARKRLRTFHQKTFGGVELWILP